MDAEHRELIERINLLSVELQSGYYQTNVIDQFQELYTAAAKHFAHEEALMRLQNYDRYREHQADHQHLLDEINLVMTECLQGMGNEAVMIERLHNRFYTHFMTRDAHLHQIIGKT